MSDGKNPAGKAWWFAPLGEPAPAFGFRPNADLGHDESTGRFVRFVFAAHAIGADAEAVATFLNGLKPQQTPLPWESEGF
jgi:hypothetical protein